MNGGRAVIIGGSIAGLLAARVLADHFRHVTVVERDLLPLTPQFRPGVSQAYHSHTLLPRGRVVLEQLFPGLAEELTALGAVPFDMGREAALFLSGGWRMPRGGPSQLTAGCSRPLLDAALHRRLAAKSKVQIVQEHEVTGLSVADDGRRVTGVWTVNRHDPRASEQHIPADLILDASGRYSQAPAWLVGLGYEPPLDTIVNAFTGYASMIVHRPAGFHADWKALYVRPMQRSGPRGGIILPMEGDRWHVTLIGMARDYPPTRYEEFLAFARSLPTSRLYEAISEAEPLGPAHGYLNTANRLRRYDRLSDYLEGFLVLGDAAHTLNPVYAQGMTLAAEDSLVLDRVLSRHLGASQAGDLSGLARSFHKTLREAISSPWRMATNEDRRWPETQIEDGVHPTRHFDRH